MVECGRGNMNFKQIGVNLLLYWAKMIKSLPHGVVVTCAQFKITIYAINIYIENIIPKGASNEMF